MLAFGQKLQNYADLLVRFALNLQEGQELQISAEVVHLELANLIVETAYRAGAKYVQLNVVSPRADRARIQYTKNSEDLDYLPDYLASRMDHFIDHRGATLSLVGSGEPDLFSDLSPQLVNRMSMARRKKFQRFYKEGIHHSKVHWCVASAATPRWAKKVYPELSEEQALAALWNDIFFMSRADTSDWLARWERHNAILHKRSKLLTELNIKDLHFVGPGTDLRVGLSKRARFQGGTHPSSPSGLHFEPNIPTEECFTTPDFRKTEGHVRVTRPFLIHDMEVKGLEIVFKEGKIASYTAEKGEEIFGEYIASDEGGSRLGEVALVGIDSPIYQTGRLYGEILIDENAACHIAVGSAYLYCLEGGEALSHEELADLGYNESHCHTDMMISSEKVDVTAHTYSGDEVHLLVKGEWQAPFSS